MAMFACKKAILKDLETHAPSGMRLQRCQTGRKKPWADTAAGPFHANLIIAPSTLMKHAPTAGKKHHSKTVWPQHHMSGIVAENSMSQAHWKPLRAYCLQWVSDLPAGMTADDKIAFGYQCGVRRGICGTLVSTVFFMKVAVCHYVRTPCVRERHLPKRMAGFATPH